MIWAQKRMPGWPISVHLKFLRICMSVTAVLLGLYHLRVRCTPVATLLHGKRHRYPGPRPAWTRPMAASRP